ncbi:response regulator transcription factor [Paenibacillus oryzisoli]|uniref:response regulator n=1 Tax=Paenibacillus oryzisoli TaxID=1850517 RepID=UPI003D2A8DA3
MPKIVVVDDHAVVRSGLMSLLSGKHGNEVIGEATNGEEGIQAALMLKPDVVLMDLNMPGMDGLKATAELKRLMPEVEVLVLTMHDDDEYLFQAIHAGASGYVLKSAPHEELLLAIQSVSRGQAYLYPTATKRLMHEYMERLKTGEPTGTYETLSEREKEVIALLAKGFSNKEIAEQLIISVKTVETHKSNAMEKLGLKTRPELVKYAAQKGWLTFE